MRMISRPRTVAVVLLAAVLGLGYGVARFFGAAPGWGPLTDPGSQASDAGYTGGSSSGPIGEYHSGMLSLVNFSRVSATLDSVSLDHATPGLTLVAAHVVDRDPRCNPVVAPWMEPGPPADSDCIHPLKGFSIPPQSGWHMTPAEFDVDHAAWPILLVLRIEHSGTFSFRGIDVHYHVGPFNYTSTYKLGQTVCTPAGTRCSYSG
jgi:hypothetical protein